LKDAAQAAKMYFGSDNIKSIQFVSPEFARKYKVVVFVPVEKTDELMMKMASAGAGKIGKYSLCSFRVTGIGTFKGAEGSNPAYGKKNRLEKVEESRFEMICGQNELEKVIDMVYKFHPYEEPACEIYNVIVKDTVLNKKTALVKLKRKIAAADIMKKLNAGIENDLIRKLKSGKKADRAFIDLTGKTDFTPAAGRTKTLVIKKQKNIFNIEVI